MNKLLTALDKKLRFNYNGKTLTTEDLLHIGTNKTFSTILDSIYVELENSLPKGSGLIQRRASSKVSLQLEVVKEIYEFRVQKLKDAENAALVKTQKESLLALAAKKDEEEFSAKYENMTADQLRKEAAKA